MTGPVATAAPLISVVIPCFNYARFVAGAIDSALCQSYPNKEVIIVDDGSTDESPEIIARYATRARIIRQDNQGSVAAYNCGFAATKGDIVIFLDADDLLAPDALARVAGAWYPTCAKVQYDLRIIDAAGVDLGRRFCNFDAAYDAATVRESFARTGTYRWPVTAGNAYSRWFIGPLFPLRIDHGPDGTLNTVAPVYGDIVTIPDALGFYRIHGANMWASDGLDYSRLPHRIHDRQREVALMRAHAGQRGVAVPSTNVLDHEIPFLNYRLMAFKLGLDYHGKGDDSVPALWLRLCRVLASHKLPLALNAAHLSWFVGLGLAPRLAVPKLIRLRFNRAAVLESVRRNLTRLRPWHPPR